MNKNLTEIIFIIDQSGSMQPLIDDTIGGFNGFIDEQKALDGRANLTTVLFSNTHHKIHDGIDLLEAARLDRSQYRPSGGTAMLDAIGDTINEVQDRIDNTQDDMRPGNVIVAITTDGQENSSVRYNKFQIQKMIEHQTKGHGWQFVFLGANMDAVSEAKSIGINYAATYTADTLGTKAVYSSVSAATKDVRLDGLVSESWDTAVRETSVKSSL